MNSNDGDRLIEECSAQFEDPWFLTYEQVCPNDAFGKIMINNLMVCYCILRSVAGACFGKYL